MTAVAIRHIGQMYRVYFLHRTKGWIWEVAFLSKSHARKYARWVRAH